MKKKIFIILLSIFLVRAYSEDFKFKEIDLDPQYELDKEILSHYGNLWIRYQTTSKSYLHYKEKCHPISVIEFYYKKNSEFIFLGKMDTKGIYDKNNNVLCSNVLLKDRFASYQALGFTETSLTDPFFTGQYYLRDETNFGGLDPYAQVSIDFDNNTLIVTHVSD